MFKEVLELLELKGDLSSVYTSLPPQQVFVNAHLSCKLIKKIRCDISSHYILPEAIE